MGPLVALLLFFFFSSPAISATLAGVTLPDRHGDLVLNGLGLREATWLRIDVYVAGLYLPRKTHDPAVILDPAVRKHLVMHFVRRVTRADVTKAWRDGFEVVAPGASGELREEIDRLISWSEAIPLGGEMAFDHVPGRGLAVTVNGKEKGVLPGDAFSRTFWLLWVGPDVPFVELKRGLLGRE